MHAETGAARLAAVDLEGLMVRYQQADGTAAAVLVEQLSPHFYRFFTSQFGSSTEADDMLQELWLRIHRVRHTYRPSAPLLPWVYAIAHRVRIDNYRKRHRKSREIGVRALPEYANPTRGASGVRGFDELVASLPGSQREILRMRNVDGLSIDEIARATSSTTGAVKQKAHRAYRRLRTLLESQDHSKP